MRDLPHYLIVQCADCAAYAMWIRTEQTLRLDHNSDCTERDNPLTLKVDPCPSTS